MVSSPNADRELIDLVAIQHPPGQLASPRPARSAAYPTPAEASGRHVMTLTLPTPRLAQISLHRRRHLGRAKPERFVENNPVSGTGKGKLAAMLADATRPSVSEMIVADACCRHRISRTASSNFRQVAPDRTGGSGTPRHGGPMRCGPCARPLRPACAGSPRRRRAGARAIPNAAATESTSFASTPSAGRPRPRETGATPGRRSRSTCLPVSSSNTSRLGRAARRRDRAHQFDDLPVGLACDRLAPCGGKR